jgi:16S rRNA G527 N7-methylase RsmG
MEIRAQAADHSALASFVRELVEQPEVEDVKVVNTRVHRYTSAQVVSFELAVVIKSAG